jgi:hypothetical protein
VTHSVFASVSQDGTFSKSIRWFVKNQANIFKDLATIYILCLKPTLSDLFFVNDAFFAAKLGRFIAYGLFCCVENTQA